MSATDHFHNIGKANSQQHPHQPEDQETEMRDQQLDPGSIVRHAALSSQMLTPSHVLQLQRAIGNRAVARLLQNNSPSVETSRPSNRIMRQWMPRAVSDPPEVVEKWIEGSTSKTGSANNLSLPKEGAQWYKDVDGNIWFVRTLPEDSDDADPILKSLQENQKLPQPDWETKFRHLWETQNQIAFKKAIEESPDFANLISGLTELAQATTISGDWYHGGEKGHNREWIDVKSDEEMLAHSAFAQMWAGWEQGPGMYVTNDLKQAQSWTKDQSVGSVVKVTMANVPTLDLSVTANQETLAKIAKIIGYRGKVTGENILKALSPYNLPVFLLYGAGSIGRLGTITGVKMVDMGEDSFK